MEMAGLGKLSPNMMMIGFQEKWFTCSDDANDFVKTLQAAFDLHLSVGVLRVQGGLDLSSMGLTKVLDNIGYHIFVSKIPKFRMCHEIDFYSSFGPRG